MTKKKKKKKPKDDASGTAAPTEKEADENLPTEPKVAKEKKSKNVAFAGETTEVNCSVFRRSMHLLFRSFQNQKNVSSEAAPAAAAAATDEATAAADDDDLLSKKKKKKAKSRDGAATGETDAQVSRIEGEFCIAPIFFRSPQRAKQQTERKRLMERRRKANIVMMMWVQYVQRGKSIPVFFF